jgi:LmbE family N-acetylglucosaminyl deacetylase
LPPAPRRLLITVAHPDDETFGTGSTIAHYAAAGIEVHVVCASRGEEGEIAPGSSATPETLGDVREAELRAAAELMGVKQVHLLGYRDSGMVPVEEVENPDAFVNANEADLMVKLTRLIRDIRPHVVVTMPLDGGTGHGDHIRISEATTRAFKLAAHPGYLEPGGLVHSPTKLYYHEIPRSVMQKFMEAIEQSNPEMLQFMLDAGIDKFGVDDEDIAAKIDVSDVLDTRIKAIAMHESQDSPFNLIPEDMIPMALGTDYFTRAIPAWTGGEPEDDLFVGL